MEKQAGPYTRKSAYDPDVTRIVGVRMKPDTLRKLRLIAANADKTVCSMLREYAERLAVEGLSH
jgi:hypothetical protein